ncbi:hypothetical protein DN752_03190 [Echinicola strongylocentroti]|uniref:Uncharacterized protein n=1 Tax=Echinicola strongylocentroti TaxID=1795355 RepID=A0A2Z4IE90_9BACT|nr:hypothetical protein [Echinicola strongylocentroti]AWW29224.1 hypothetical protein DN752_03190 [Echinicola strongylocentroti]
MEQEHKKTAFKKWLDNLQQESWQLELIISGFLIYALFSAFGTLLENSTLAVAQENLYRSIVALFSVFSVFILMLNLCIHLILRGIWIAAIGLRSVSGEIDYEKLKLKGKFHAFLTEKVGPFDKYIAFLEKYSSIIFANTFLMIFFLFSVFVILGVLLIIKTLFILLPTNTFTSILEYSVTFLYLLGVLLTFIDFMTISGLKRSRIIAKVYYPFYRFFSIITLSIFYRPMIYNLIDNKFGRRMIRVIIPAYLLILFVASLDYHYSAYLPFESLESPKKNQIGASLASPDHYLDELNSEIYVLNAAIQSKTISENHLQVFVSFHQEIEDIILANCNGLAESKIRKGLFSKILPHSTQDDTTVKQNLMTYLNCFQQQFKVYIDGQRINSDFVISSIHNGQVGFESNLPLQQCTPGKHVFRIEHPSESVDSFASIVFWYYP